MSEKKYYYMSIAWTPKHKTQHKIIGRVTNKHPLQAMLDVNTPTVNDGEYILITWNELTEDEFNQYKSLTT